MKLFQIEWISVMGQVSLSDDFMNLLRVNCESLIQGAAEGVFPSQSLIQEEQLKVFPPPNP